MLKQARKKKVKYSLPESPAEQIVCGACNHVREETATNPKWQCPGCGVAYNKVNQKPEEKRYTQEELKKKNREYLENEQQGLLSDEEVSQHAVSSGLSIGGLTFWAGTARTVTSCAGLKKFVPANPVLMVVGAAIILGTLAYAYFKYMK